MHCTSDGNVLHRVQKLPHGGWVAQDSVTVRACGFAEFAWGTQISSWFKLLLWVSVVATLVHAEPSLNHSTHGLDKRSMRATRSKIPMRAMNFSIVDSLDIDFTEDYGVRKISDMADKDLNYMVSKNKISTVYLQKDVTLYRKELPFTHIPELLGNV
jgi:hypothetical protein